MNKVKKSRSLKTDIRNLLIVAAVIPLLLIAMIDFIILSKSHEEINNIRDTDRVNSIEVNLNENYAKTKKDLETLSNNSNFKNLLNLNDNEKVLTQKILESYISITDDALFLYVVTKNGEPYVIPNSNNDSGNDITQREWYKDAINNPNVVMVSKPYIDKIKEKTIITYSKAILNENQEVIGVMAIDKDFDKVLHLTTFEDSKQGSIENVISEDGTILVSKNSKLIGKTYEDFKWINKILEASSKKQEYIKIDDEYYSMIKVIDDNSNLNIVRLTPIKELLGDYISIIIVPISIFIIVFIAIGILSKIYSKKLSNPIKEVVKNLNRLENGDFTENVVIKDIYNEEVNSMLKAINSLVKDMVILLLGVKESTNKVNIGATTLFDIIVESTHVGNEVTISIQEIAEGATNQAGQLDEGVKVVADLENEINKSVNSSKKMLEASKDVKQSSFDGSIAIKKLNGKYDENLEANNNIIKKVDLLTEKSNEISKIIETIKSITEQTNLLALNASIEAARAGEIGRGFAVVAEEVRKLADGSAKAASEINHVLDEIKSGINELYKDTIVTTKINKETEESLIVTREKFDIIESSIGDLEKDINEVSESLVKINKSKDYVVYKMSEVSAVGQETAAITEEVSAATEEQLAGLQEMENQAQELKSSINILENLVNKFKID